MPELRVKFLPNIYLPLPALRSSEAFQRQKKKFHLCVLCVSAVKSIVSTGKKRRRQSGYTGLAGEQAT